MDEAPDLHVTEPLAYFIYFTFIASLSSLSKVNVNTQVYMKPSKKKIGKLIIKEKLVS